MSTTARTESGHEKSALHTAQLGGKDSAKDAHSVTHKGETHVTNPIIIPRRFRQLHDGGSVLFVANQYRDDHITAEETIVPSIGPDPVLNLEISITEATVEEMRDVFSNALSWLHSIEAQLPNGTETNR